MFKLLFPLLILACQLSYCQYFDVGIDGVKLERHQHFSENIFNQDSSVYFLINNEYRSLRDTSKLKTSQFLLEYGKSDLNLKRRINLYSKGKRLYDVEFCKTGIIALYYELSKKESKRFIGFVPNGKNQVEKIIETKDNIVFGKHEKYGYAGIIRYKESPINNLINNPFGGYFLVGYNQFYKIDEDFVISDADTNEYYNTMDRLQKVLLSDESVDNSPFFYQTQIIFPDAYYGVDGPRVTYYKNKYEIHSSATSSKYSIELLQKIRSKNDLNTYLIVSENIYNAKNDSFETVLDSIKFGGLHRRNFYSSFYSRGEQNNIFLIDLYLVNEDKEMIIGSNIHEINLKDKTVNLKTSKKIVVDENNIVHKYLVNTLKKELRLNYGKHNTSRGLTKFDEIYKIPNGETSLVFSFGNNNNTQKPGNAPGFYCILFDKDMNLSNILYSNHVQGFDVNIRVLDGVVDEGVYMIQWEQKINEKVFNDPSKVTKPKKSDGGMYFSVISDKPKRIRLTNNKTFNYYLFTDRAISVIEDNQIVYYLPMQSKSDKKMFLGKLEINKLYQEAKSFSFINK